jgi:hypothetical protein
LARIRTAFKVVVAEQSYQPNNEISTSLLLSPDELPGNGWTTSGQREMSAHAFKKNNPIMDRAKTMKSTTSRRLIENPSQSRSIIDEVTPLASATDAASWVSSADQRLKSNLSKVGIDVNDFREIQEVPLASVGVARGFEYTLTLKKGPKASTLVVANVDDVYMSVTCGSFDEPWTFDDVLNIARVQVMKIRNMKGKSSD